MLRVSPVVAFLLFTLLLPSSHSMKAYVYDKASPSGMTFLKDFQHSASAAIESAPLARGQLLVDVKAVSLNPVDYKKPGVPLVFGDCNLKPASQDFAGVVIGAGEGSSYKVGDEVFGVGIIAYGVLVEKTVVAERNIAKKPAGISFAEAASLPTTAVTGLQALQGQGLQKGGTCIVIGASGGCGIVGVQIARSIVGKGGQVYGITSAKNFPAVERLRACDGLLDYARPESITGPDSVLRKSKVDVIYDTVSSTERYDSFNGQSYQDALSFTGARIAAINGSGLAFLSYFLGLQYVINIFSSRYKLSFANINSAAMTSIAELVERGELQTVIDQTFDMTEEGCARAFDRIRSRRAVGKVVINVGA